MNEKLKAQLQEALSDALGSLRMHGRDHDTTINTLELAEAELKKEPTLADVVLIFDGPPGPESGRFVEAEDASGQSLNIGEWSKRGDGFWALRIPGHALAHGFARVEEIDTTFTAVCLCGWRSGPRLKSTGAMADLRLHVGQAVVAQTGGGGDAEPAVVRPTCPSPEPGLNLHATVREPGGAVSTLSVESAWTIANDPRGLRTILESFLDRVRGMIE